MRAVTVFRMRGVALLSVAAATAAVFRQAPAIDADALRVLSAREELRLGTADDPKGGFNAIGGVDVDRDGQIYVYDSQDKTIRVFARDGQPVRTIGRAGTGPGEFTRVSAFGIIGDTVWTLDRGDLRVNMFRRDGSLISTRSLPTPTIVSALQDGAVGLISPRVMRGDGRFLSGSDVVFKENGATQFLQGRNIGAGVGTTDTARVPRVRYTFSGTVDTVGWEPVPPRDAPARPVATTRMANRQERIGVYVTVAGVEYSIPQAPPDGYLRMTIADGSFVVTRHRASAKQPSQFEMVRYYLSGKTMHRLRFTYRPGRYSGPVLDTLAMRVVNRQNPPSRGAAFTAVRGAMKFPEFQAPVFTVWSGNDSSIWLRRENNAGPRMRWIVIARSGAVRGVVEIPTSAVPAWARADTVLAVDTDELGVPFVVRYRLSFANGRTP